MKCTMFFHGGPGYAAPTDEDGEEFFSVAEAKRTFRRRADFDLRYPCVENPEAWIVRGHDATQENGPDFVLTIGPRGGVRRERA